jgi:signal transduction histidine kinase
MVLLITGAYFFLQIKMINHQHSWVGTLIIIAIGYLFLTTAGSLFMAKRAIAPIQNAWQQQKNFLADASHQLRTPLAIIQTNLEVVLSNPQETVASQMDWLNNVQEELQQMTGLVSSLLFLARLDSGQWTMEKTHFWLDKVVIHLSEVFRPAAAIKSINLDTSITGQVICYGDESNIRQVIEILLDNAIRHTPANGKISLNLQQSEKKILLTITDNGEGIAPEHLSKIFDRFYQVDDSPSKGKAGLGLSIAKSIINNHGGTLLVTSILGKGTTFTIELPLENTGESNLV